jgi:molybdate transport system substrate-binding protein
VPKPATRFFAAILGLAAALSVGTAGAAELKVWAAIAFRPALQELAPAFEKTSGHKLAIQYDTAGKIADKVTGEDTIDVAIVTKPLFDKLARAAKIVDGTRTPLAQQVIGLAVKKGAAKPDISSVDAFKKTLLAAKSIAYVDPASGGAASIHLVQSLEKIGIAGELKARTKLLPVPADPGGNAVAEAVQKGEVEIAIQPLAILLEAQGLDIVGPLPADLQSSDLMFVAGTPWTCEQPLAANALFAFLKTPEAMAAYRKHGMEPG